ncbi:MAG: ketopantoate reductase family protein [bacterium]
MRYVIYGAGGIGGVVGARLFASGADTTLIARGEHGRVLRQRGLRLVAPDGTSTLKIPAVEHPRDAVFDEQTVVVLCMKSQHTLSALQDLALCAPVGVHVLCMQNGVANESLALRFFANVYASVVVLPALFLQPGEVVTHADGAGAVLDVGCFPGGSNAVVQAIAGDLTHAGFSARPDAAVMRQKYGKLRVNLLNVLQAGLTDFSASKPIHKLLRDEASACFAAAGIDCADREEMAQRQAGVFSMVDIPGYERTAGSSWQSMARGTGDIETDYLNGEICWLGRLHGVPTPANDACVGMARALVRRNAGPGIYSSAELLAQIQAAAPAAG